MSNSQQIKNKKASIRLNLKQTLIKSGHLMSQHIHSPIKIQSHPQVDKEEVQSIDSPPLPTVTRARRKTSLDIRVMGDDFDMFQCNQILIYHEFGQMYELVRKIDEGMESVVYEGIQKSTGLIYAVKVFKKKDQDIINRLKTQFRILKNLNHPFIIKAYNLFINQKIGISHLVLQYCSYLNLRFHMLKCRILKQTEIAEILSYILSAVAYLHSQGICHRDIKPENILFDPVTRHLKLIDFQIAKMIKYSHQKLEMLTGTGTIYYRAPEMLVSGMYSQLVDIWAIGVICYEMLTGDLPFKHLYQNQVSKLIKQSQPKYDLPNITDLCINFLKKCLSKDPLKRFTAAQALKSPFILKYSSISSNSSPMRRKNSQENLRNLGETSPFEFQVNKCYDEDSNLKNRQSLQHDNGIRLVVQQKRIKLEQA